MSNTDKNLKRYIIKNFNLKMLFLKSHVFSLLSKMFVKDESLISFGRMFHTVRKIKKMSNTDKNLKRYIIKNFNLKMLP